MLPVGILSVHLFIAHLCKSITFTAVVVLLVSTCFACSSAIMVIVYSCLLEMLFETCPCLSHETVTTCVNSDPFLGILICYSGCQFYGKLSKTQINYGEPDLKWNAISLPNWCWTWRLAQLYNAWNLIFDNPVLWDHINSLCKTDMLKQLNFKYLAEDQFNSQYGNDVHIELGLFHVNIRTLNLNAGRLCQFLQLLSVNFDVIVLSKIWKG